MGVWNTIYDSLTTYYSFGQKDEYLALYSGLYALGAIVGSLLAGIMVEKLGRRKLIMVADVVCVVSCLLMQINEISLGVGRFLYGAVVGIASVVVPIYIKEIVPTHISGFLVGLHQFFITLGIAVAYLFRFLVSDSQEKNQK